MASSSDALHDRLTALHEASNQLQDLISRLASITFEPGTVPLSTTDPDAAAANPAAELSAEIGQLLREQEEDLELLREEVVDLRSGRPGSEAEQRKARLKDGVQRLETDLEKYRAAFRRAQVAARRTLEEAQKREREMLLAAYAALASTSAVTSPVSRSGAVSPMGSHQLPPQLVSRSNTQQQSQRHQPQPEPSSPASASADSSADPNDDPHARLFPRHRYRQKYNNNSPFYAASTDPAVTTSTDITLSLRRTHALIAGELAKSTFAAQTLAESTAALAELQRSYSGLDALLGASRELVGELVAARRSDTWYLQMALRMLLWTLAWLIFRRWLYGPLWWLVWLPVRTGWRVGSGVTKAVVGGSGEGKSSSASVSVSLSTRGTGVTGVVEGTAGEEEVPLIQVGLEEEPKEARKGEPESMVEQVGRIVEDTLNQIQQEEEANRTENADKTEEPAPEPELEEKEEVQPNPKKRMWDAESEPMAEPVPARDEL